MCGPDSLHRCLSTASPRACPFIFFRQTAPYLAPECFDPQNKRLTDRADVYSFGVMLVRAGGGATVSSSTTLMGRARA